MPNKLSEIRKNSEWQHRQARSASLLFRQSGAAKRGYHPTVPVRRLASRGPVYAVVVPVPQNL